MYGSFNEDAQQVWDFVRCQRPNGTFYGTSGKCRKGSEAGAKEKIAPKPVKAKKKKPVSKTTPQQKKVLDKAIAEKKEKKTSKPAEKPAAKLSQAEYDKQLKSLEEKKKQMMNDYFRLDDERQKSWVYPENHPIRQKAEAAFAKAADDYKTIKSAIQELEKKNPAKGTKDVIDVVARDEERNRRQNVYRTAQANANLNPKQKAAIRDYTDEGGERPYSDLNACLRQPKICDPSNRKWTKQHAKELDSALKALPKNENAEPFWRGTRADSGQALALYQALENAQPGTRISDPAFGSYSYDESVAKGFTSRQTKSILFVSRNKELRPVDVFSEIPLEREALLPRDVEQIVRSIRKDGEMLIVELE